MENRILQVIHKHNLMPSNKTNILATIIVIYLIHFFLKNLVVLSKKDKISRNYIVYNFEDHDMNKKKSSVNDTYIYDHSKKKSDRIINNFLWFLFLTQNLIIIKYFTSKELINKKKHKKHKQKSHTKKK